MWEERYLYLNEEEYIIIEYNMDEHWSDVDDYGEDRNKFHVLR